MGQQSMKSGGRTAIAKFLLLLTAFLALAGAGLAVAQSTGDFLADEEAKNRQAIEDIDRQARDLVQQLKQNGREIEYHKTHKPADRDRDTVRDYNNKSDELNTEHKRLVSELDRLTAQQDGLRARNREIAALRALPFKVSPLWGKIPDGLKQLQRLARLISTIPDRAGDSTTGTEVAVGKAFKDWVAVNVVVEPAPTQVLGVSAKPGKLEFDPVLFEKGGPDRQKNLLALELGKVLWFDINGNDSKVAQTEAGRAFQTLYERHMESLSLSALKTAPLGKTHLGDLGDLDLQSHFGYAVRVALFQLPPPADASRDWVEGRSAMQRYMMGLLARR